MHLAIRHLNLQPGEEVFCSTATFAASVNPVLYERGSSGFHRQRSGDVDNRLQSPGKGAPTLCQAGVSCRDA